MVMELKNQYFFKMAILDSSARRGSKGSFQYEWMLIIKTRGDGGDDTLTYLLVLIKILLIVTLLCHLPYLRNFHFLFISSSIFAPMASIKTKYGRRYHRNHNFLHRYSLHRVLRINKSIISKSVQTNK